MFIRPHTLLLNATTGDAATGAGASPPPAAPPPPAPPPAAPAQPPPAAASATTPPAVTPPQERDPNWLNERIAKAKTSTEKSLLRELGVDSLDDAKKAITALQAQRDAEKTASEKAAEYETALKAERARIASLTEAVAAHANAQLAALTDEQRAAVTAIAGEDPAAQLKTLEALRPTWKQAAPATQVASATQVATPPAGAPPPAGATPPATPPVPPPADTAPAPNAPKDSSNISPADPKATYVELKKTNPVLAARYAFAHGVHDSQ